MIRVTGASILLSCMLAFEASAQATAVVTGTVVDSATQQAVAGAIITLRSGDRVMADRTDEAGGFRIPRVPAGEVVAELKRIGYRQKSVAFVVRVDTSVKIVLSAAARTLAPVNVLGKGEGVYGVIAGSADLKPIRAARVFVIGSGTTVTTDSAGEFFVPLKQPGSYLIRVTADGFGEDVLPLNVRRNEVVESSHLLDASDRKPLSAGLWDDFDQRLRWRPVSSALVSGSELRAAGASMQDALQSTPSVVKRQLQIVPENVCLFVDGQPRPGQTISDFRVEDIRAIELYMAKDSAYISNLTKLWPIKLPCGSGLGPMGSGRRPPIRGQAVIKWAVIWLR